MVSGFKPIGERSVPLGFNNQEQQGLSLLLFFIAVMYKKILAHCAALTSWKVLVYGLILAFLFEAITIALRFGFRLESTRDTGAIGAFTFGLRIHHGYIGLFLLPLAWCFPLGLRHALWIIAIGLIFSDLAHHFLVLWPITGSPQFDIVYPQHPYWSR